MEPMSLSWFTQHGLEGFLRIAEAPPHDEPGKVAKKIDLEEITEDVIHALIGLPKGGIYSIENPSPEMLTKFFNEYSLTSKAYRTQGGDDALFREVAPVLHGDGFMHSRPRQCLRTESGSLSQHTKG